MVLSINRLRVLIVCLALVSSILGIIVKEKHAYPDILTITLAAEVVAVFLYSEFAYRSKAETQFRGWRIFLRLIMAFLTAFGPATALPVCTVYTRRDYDIETPGFHAYEEISCMGYGGYDTRSYGESLLPSFRLFRARCIITLTVCVLIIVELFCYGRSDEGSGHSRDGAMAETRSDVELANTAVGEPQKIMVSDPPNGA